MSMYSFTYWWAAMFRTTSTHHSGTRILHSLLNLKGFLARLLAAGRMGKKALFDYLIFPISGWPGCFENLPPHDAGAFREELTPAKRGKRHFRAIKLVMSKAPGRGSRSRTGALVANRYTGSRGVGERIRPVHGFLGPEQPIHLLCLKE